MAISPVFGANAFKCVFTILICIGGQQYFWKVTLVENRVKDGIFRLDEHTLPLGELPPVNIPYQEVAPRLTVQQLENVIPYISQKIGKAALALRPEKPSAELYHERWMGI